MAVNIERVQSALRASISGSQKPTQAQLLEIAGMTHMEEALKEIQRMIRRRVQHANQYPPWEVYHTLVVMQKCLVTASRDFVSFCTTLLPAISVLIQYEASGAPGLEEISSLVRSGANSLCGDLVNPGRLSGIRSTVLKGEAAAPIKPPPTNVQNRPLPSSPTGKAKSSGMTPLNTGLLTPDPSPDTFSRIPLGKESKGNSGTTPQSTKSRNSPFNSLISMKNEEIARLTFKSEDLTIILDILDEFLGVTLLQGTDPNDIVKALTLIHHCLFWGSDEFVDHFRSMKSIFNALQRHSAITVKGRANAVVELLDDARRLHQERNSRAKLIGTNHGSTLPEHPEVSPRQKQSTQVVNARAVLNQIKEPVLDLSGHVKKLGTRPVGGGGYSDVWQGKYTPPHGAEILVAIKILRRFDKVPPERIAKRRNRELRAWRDLEHKNITPFYGVITDSDGEIGMVSPYYSDGNMVDYLKKKTKRHDPLTMLQEVADGMAYLHSQNIVHGDIKGSNVMISEGSPRLIDFGLSQFVEKLEETGYTTSNFAISLRWSAPELLIGDSSTSSKTKKSDIYAFASLCVEIMTLRSPYNPKFKRDPQILGHVLVGGIPERPSMEDMWSPCDELWASLKMCWREKPEDRPDTAAVRHKLAEFTPSDHRPLATVSPRVAWRHS